MDEKADKLEMGFVQRRYRYYKLRWQGKRDTEFFLSWNWAAFLLGGEWLLFRKMYIEAAITLASLLAMLFYIADTGWLIFFLLLIRVVVGLCGNSLYYQHTKYKLGKYRGMLEEEALPLVWAAGGVNYIAVAVWLLVFRWLWMLRGMIT